MMLPLCSFNTKEQTETDRLTGKDVNWNCYFIGESTKIVLAYYSEYKVS